MSEPQFHRSMLKGKDGLRVVGDAHGNWAALAPVLEEARERNLAVLFLGDLIDRGPDAPSCMRAGLKHLMVPGNHEDKFWRHRQGRPVQVAHGLAETLAQLAADPDGEALAEAYAARVADAPLWLIAGRYLFVHAGFDPAMLDTPPLTIARRGKSGLAARALFGQTDGTLSEDGFPVRLYDWVDQVPAGLTVVIGHHVVSTTEIVERRGKLGGRVLHLDTGADRGGPLSFLDIPAAELGEPVVAPPPRLDELPVPSETLLTLLVGPSGAGKSTWAAANAEPDAVISSDAVRRELFGDHETQNGGDRVFGTVYERALARLRRGRPVVIDATHIRRKDRLTAAALVPSSWRVRYVVLNRPVADKHRDAGWRARHPGLIERHEQIFASQLPEILKGDGLPNVEVVDLRRTR